MSDEWRWNARDRDWYADRERYEIEQRRQDERLRRPPISPYGGADWRGLNVDYGRDDRGSGYPHDAGRARAQDDRSIWRTPAFDRPDRGGPNRAGEERGWLDMAGDEVSSWFGDHEAERRRSHDQARGEHRGRGPSGYRRSDERIREDVSDRLSDDSWLDASNIEVKVSNGEVTLGGTVHDRRDKRHAEDLAERVSGVSHVQNNLRVKSPGSGMAQGGSQQTFATGQGAFASSSARGKETV
jgi:hypothetical protein